MIGLPNTPHQWGRDGVTPSDSSLWLFGQQKVWPYVMSALQIIHPCLATPPPPPPPPSSLCPTTRLLWAPSSSLAAAKLAWLSHTAAYYFPAARRIPRAAVGGEPPGSSCFNSTWPPPQAYSYSLPCALGMLCTSISVCPAENGMTGAFFSLLGIALQAQTVTIQLQANPQAVAQLPQTGRALPAAATNRFGSYRPGQGGMPQPPGSYQAGGGGRETSVQGGSWEHPGSNWVSLPTDQDCLHRLQPWQKMQHVHVPYGPLPCSGPSVPLLQPSSPPSSCSSCLRCWISPSCVPAPSTVCSHRQESPQGSGICRTNFCSVFDSPYQEATCGNCNRRSWTNSTRSSWP